MTQPPQSQQHSVSCTATAPTRIDLAGGTLDVWPLAPILQEKCELWNKPLQTINVAIGLRAHAQVRLSQGLGFEWHFEDKMSQAQESGSRLDNKDAARFSLHRAVARHYRETLLERGYSSVEIVSNAQAPKGSGLGGSSALVVAMLTCFETLLHENASAPDQLCATAQNLEAGILGNLAGNQDHYAAALGGVQAVQHSAHGTRSRRLSCDGDALMARMVLAHSGQQHFSAFNNWLILEKALTGDAEVLDKCARIARIAHALVQPLEAGDWVEVARLMSEEWSIRRTLAPGITTNVLESLYQAGMESGAAGGKVCGAGGGGVLVLIARRPEDTSRIRAAVEDTGGILLPTEYSAQGTCTTLGG